MHSQEHPPALPPQPALRSPYTEILRDRYRLLHPHVRIAHQAPLSAAGHVDVVHGRHLLTPILIWLMNLPQAGSHVPVDLRVTPDGQASDTVAPVMRWTRQIGTHALHTRQFSRDGYLVEASGPGRVTFALQVVDEALEYEDVSLHLLRIPIPSRLAPRVRARVAAAEPGWHVDVRVEWHGHLICRYGGHIWPLAYSA